MLWLSMKWWGTPCISAGVGLAVPMLSSRKNWRESAETISVWNCWASCTHRAVLPTAVGPAMVSSTGRGSAAVGASWARISGGSKGKVVL